MHPPSDGCDSKIFSVYAMSYVPCLVLLAFYNRPSDESAIGFDLNSNEMRLVSSIEFRIHFDRLLFEMPPNRDRAPMEHLKNYSSLRFEMMPMTNTFRLIFRAFSMHVYRSQCAGVHKSFQSSLASVIAVRVFQWAHRIGHHLNLTHCYPTTMTTTRTMSHTERVTARRIVKSASKRIAEKGNICEK